jgi:hypothetical protein
VQADVGAEKRRQTNKLLRDGFRQNFGYHIRHVRESKIKGERLLKKVREAKEVLILS